MMEHGGSATSMSGRSADDRGAAGAGLFLGLGAVAAIGGLILCLILVRAFIQLPLVAFTTPLTKTPSWDAKDKLDALAAVATIALPVIAVIAGGVALLQVRQSEKSHSASIYLAIAERFNSEYMREGRRAAKELWNFSASASTDSQLRSQYVSRILVSLQQGFGSAADNARYMNSLRVIDFWEQMAVLASHDLIRKAILFDYYAGELINTKKIFGHYMHARRTDLNSKTLFANALRLMDEADRAKPTSYNDG